MPTGGGKIAAAYIRVSTEDQIEYSPAAQLVEIRKYAAAHGFALMQEYQFMDEGISGKNTGKRPAFNRMIGIAKQKPKPFDAILLWKFSRFARNREDSIVYKSMLRRELGIEVISISEPLADDKMSIIMEAMIEAMDEYYSINLAEEVKRGMTEKARRGDLQSIPSFGFTVKENCLSPIPEEVALVQAIFDRFIAGDGLFAIARWLNNLGVTSHRGNAFENRSIEYILHNPVYLGKLRWNPAGKMRRDFFNENAILSDARHDAVISQETWDAAQRRMAEVKAQWSYHGRPLTEHRDWMSGLVRCAACGKTLVFQKPSFWKCNGYAHGACQFSQHISDEKIKGMILARMEFDQQEGVAVAYIVVSSKPSDFDEALLLQGQKKQIAVRLARLREAYLAGVETMESYAQVKALLEGQEEALAKSIEAREIKTDTKKTDALMKESIGRCMNILNDPNIDIEKKKLTAHNIVEKCIFSKENGTIELTYRLFLSDK